jgi:hypothetical protein
MSVRNLMEDIVKSCLKEMLHLQPSMECDEKTRSDIMASR